MTDDSSKIVLIAVVVVTFGCSSLVSNVLANMTMGAYVQDNKNRNRTL